MKRKVLGVVLAAMCISVAPVSAYAAAGNSGVQDVLSKIADAVSGSNSEETADAAADAQTGTADAAADAQTGTADTAIDAQTETADTTAAAETTDAAAGEAQTDAAPAEAGAATLSSNIYDFQVKIGDAVYQFPMSYEDFTAQGWTMDDSSATPEDTLGTNSYNWVNFAKGSDRVTAYLINFGINAVPLSQCLVGGVSIDGTYDFALNATPVELAGGIQMGVSGLDDIKAAYGDPSDTYEGDLYTKYTYEKDLYEEVEMYVYKDDNTLKQVDMKNLVEPEGYDKGTVSDEVPDIVTSYQAPAELGADLLDPQVEYCGDLYTLPAPVSAFLANGWTLSGVEDGAFVAGGDVEFIDMMKNNQSVHFSIYNLTENATSVENCFVRELSYASYDNEALALKLSGGFELGAKKADLIAEAEAKGYLYSEDGDYLNIYKTENTKIDNRAQFWFDADEGGEVSTGIQYLNRILPQ